MRLRYRPIAPTPSLMAVPSMRIALPFLPEAGRRAGWPTRAPPDVGAGDATAASAGCPWEA